MIGIESWPSCAVFACQEERQIALNKATEEQIEFQFPFVEKAFAHHEQEDTFLLPQTETSKVTVLKIDLSSVLVSKQPNTDKSE